MRTDLRALLWCITAALAQTVFAAGPPSRWSTAAASSDEDFLSPAGTLGILVMPVGFSNRAPALSPADISNTLFGTGPLSARSYFELQSYGGFSLTGYVTPVISLSNAAELYASDLEEQNYYINFIKELGDYYWLTVGSSYLSNHLSDSAFSNTYDGNVDGFIDLVVYLYAGESDQTSPLTNKELDVHMWSYELVPDTPSYSIRGLKVGRYLVIPEITHRKGTNAADQFTPGFFCHELAHALGLLDITDTISGAAVVGYSSLMGLGAYNSATNGARFDGTNWIYRTGSAPAPLCSFQKQLLGWIHPQRLGDDESKVIYSAYDYSDTNAAGTQVFRLEGPRSNEYWLVENRNSGSSPYDRGLGGPGGTNAVSGLMIWHVDESVMGPADSHWYRDRSTGINNSSSARGLFLEEASGTQLLALGSNHYPVEALWYSNQEGFGSRTRPMSVYNDGTPSGVCISDIGGPGAAISFLFQTFSGNRLSTVTAYALPNPYDPDSGQPLLLHVMVEGVSVAVPSIIIASLGGLLIDDLSDDVDTVIAAGEEKSVFTALWDGRDSGGNRVQPGVYYFRVLSDGYNRTAGRFLVK